MLKETNLDGVKSVARMLLLTPVHKTPYSPAVVQHPFTSCGIASLNKDGEFQLLDITAKEEDLKIWQEFMKSKIEGAENVWGIYAFINKPYGLTFLKFAEPYLSKEDFSKILGDAWVRSENPNDDPNFTKRDLIAMFKRADKQALMTEEDYKRWQDLEKSITVYRGVTPHNEKNIRALSWTLDAEKAEWFAMRFGENGKVYQAEIDKKDVYAYFGGRGESEVIVEPKGLQDITLVEEIEQIINQSM